MISHRHRCIFVHNRKAGGSSVKAMFSDPEAPRADRGAFNDGVLSPDWDAEADPVRAYFKFTVVRNPWDRFVSGWKYCHTTRFRPLKDVLRSPPRPTMAESLRAADISLSARLTYGANVILEKLIGNGRFQPGHEYRHVTRQQHETFVYADGRLAVDRVLYLETLADDMQRLAADIGLALPPEIPFRNRKRTAGDDYRAYFDDEAQELFVALFGRDIDLLGYDFDQLPPRRPIRPS